MDSGNRKIDIWKQTALLNLSIYQILNIYKNRNTYKNERISKKKNKNFTKTDSLSFKPH